MKYCLSKYTLLIEELDESVLLYNTFSGSIIKLNKNEYNNIKNSTKNEIEIEHFKELKSQGFIVHESTDEYFKMKVKANNIQQTELVDNFSYVIAPTLDCNYNCVYCFESKENRKQKMDSKTANQIIEFIINQIETHKTVKSVKITWFGGEPMLAYPLIVDFSKKIINELTKKGIEFQSNMITNGYLLTKEKACILAKECNIKHVQITLDGFEKTYSEKKQTTKYAFHKVVNNIIESCDYFKISVRLNTDKSNYNEMSLLSKYLLSDCGLKNKISIYLAEIKNYNKNECNSCYKAGEFFSIRNIFKKHLYDNGLVNKYKINNPPCFEPNFCGIIKKNNFAIGPFGELYKCEHHFGNSSMVVGDIINGIYYNNTYIKFLEGNKDVECVNCNLSPCCRSDCQAMYECHKHNGKCLIYDDLLKNLKKYIKEYVDTKSN